MFYLVIDGNVRISECGLWECPYNEIDCCTSSSFKRNWWMLCERLTFMCTRVNRCDIVYVLLPSYSSQIMEIIITHNNTVEFAMPQRVYRNDGPMEKMLQKQRLLLDLRFSEQSRKHFYAIISAWHNLLTLSHSIFILISNWWNKVQWLCRTLLDY